MNIYAIGDLHLSGEPPTKPMEVFGEHWRNQLFNPFTRQLEKVTS